MPDSVAFFVSECQKAGIYPASSKLADRIEDMLLYIMLNRSVAIIPSFYQDYFPQLEFREIKTNRKPQAHISFNILKTNQNPVLVQLLSFLQQRYIESHPYESEANIGL